MNTNSTDSIYQGLGITTQREAQRAKDEKLGQEQFLELMIAQVRNQDPFKPLENGEFLSQIAQFSTVSGIQDLQDSFSSFANNLTSNQALQASALVGRSVLVQANNGALEAGGSLSGAIALPASSSDVALGIYDANGSLVRELRLGAHEAGLLSFKWDGLTDAGVAANPGRYYLVANAQQDGETVAVPTLVTDRVESVTLGRPGQETVLNLSALGSVGINDVQEIR